MQNFEYWKKAFDIQNMFQFNNDESGIAWLKIKSIIRKEIIEDFKSFTLLNLTSTKINDYFKEIFDLYISNELTLEKIDEFLVSYNKKEIDKISKIFSEIESELYKLAEFHWGGDANNSLDKQIVKYVKDYYKYDEINNKIDNEISDSTKNYTLNSWYNHWTTILTEHLFKSNEKIISAVGKIKSVDFFIENVPIDLKITSFPKEFLKKKRKDYGYDVEITALKKIAKKLNIIFSKDTNEDVLKYQLINQIKDRNETETLNELDNIINQNKQIIDDTENNPKELITWLYEQQGEMRFGSENRLFLLLIDRENFTESWKLKRNFTLQKQKIDEYLENITKEKLLHNKIDFYFKGKQYDSFADIIFINAN